MNRKIKNLFVDLLEKSPSFFEDEKREILKKIDSLDELIALKLILRLQEELANLNVIKVDFNFSNELLAREYVSDCILEVA